ncbi:MAG: site-specific DNA-methyltransferase [Bacteroidales bacterium]|nr:site-specific DNA-methyltransferase [Bacteroidales bacterium]
MSTNISKLHREDLLDKIRQIRTYIASAQRDQNTGNLLQYLDELVKDVKGKKYGLVFEQHREAIDETLETHVPVLTEQPDLFIDNGGQMNFLIEGDNLASLQLLEKTHKGKIDVIYIDPPYNTGNEDFIYDDNYIGEDDAFRHSKWCSFMSKRLRLAKNLLTQEGVIFIQINDIEVAQLRMMCDEIFGDENFLNIISVNMKNIAGASGGGEDKKFKKNCEYILIYAKSYGNIPLFNGAYDYTEIGELVEKYKEDGVSWKYTTVLVESGQKEYLFSTVDGDGNEIKIFNRINPIIKSVSQLAKEENTTEKNIYYKYGSKIFQTAMPQSSIRPRVMEKLESEGVKLDFFSIEYVPKTGRNKGCLYEQFYKGDTCRLLAWLKDVSESIDGILYKKDLQGTYWNFVGGTKNLTKEGNVEFSNGKKPVDLLKRIISLYPQKNITVLDFFAGSGTTGHATIVQNEEDKGTRNFILCTDTQKKNICFEKTYQRIKNVLKGYTADKGKVFEPHKGSLKYYKVEFVPITDKVYYDYADELLLHVRELVELENGINFTGNSEIAIVLTDDEMAQFVETFHETSLQPPHTLYRGHNVLLTAEQEAFIAAHGIRVHVIPDYYYNEMTK